MAMPKYAVPAVAAAAVIGVLYYLRNLPAAAHSAGRDVLKPVTDGIWSLWETVRPYTTYGALNPVVGVEYTSPGFFLNSKYVSPSYKVNQQFISSMEMAHQGNKALLNKLLDPYGTIKPQYRHLINDEITEGKLNA